MFKLNIVDDVLEEVGKIVSKVFIEKILVLVFVFLLDIYFVYVDGNGQVRKILLIEMGDINGDFGFDKGIFSSVGDMYNGFMKDQFLSVFIVVKFKVLKYLLFFIKFERLN